MIDVVVPIAAIEHWAYCPRQCALIHVDGVWTDNVHTVRGARGHRRADTFAARSERGVRVVRGVPLWSERLGLTGRADAVEFHDGGTVVPVEYKIGTRHGDAADLQLAAQALCLEEMLGVPVTAGAVWFSGPRRRTGVRIDDALRARTLDTVSAIRDAMVSGVLPGAPNDERCTQCQLLGHCLPAVVDRPARVSAHVEELFACAS